ncbi:hypothetical protein FB451DRAFT_1186960 [Mycena latifolia]|nr:hypothetical protein FB451DRAFT_1186960 [Mycena latifolia]
MPKSALEGAQAALPTQRHSSRVAYATALGPDHMQQLAAIRRWPGSDAFGVVIGAASVGGLNLMAYPERIYDFVLRQAAPHTRYRRRRRPPLFRPPRASPGHLARRTRGMSMIRVALRNRRFPGSYALPFLPPIDAREWAYDPLWFELQVNVTKPGKTVRARESGEAPEAKAHTEFQTLALRKYRFWASNHTQGTFGFEKPTKSPGTG